MHEEGETLEYFSPLEALMVDTLEKIKCRVNMYIKRYFGEHHIP